eukprot:gnl/Chilomastix_caulleri/679.p1 GENE.gnl/Chilomastix_caulleri/679~~gnl/Chilomastix_caulleri/679.p1  ORF type:complete len:65 (+),score=16.98 gnl/Chilomastix_caulleri/679:154-348(+)
MIPTACLSVILFAIIVHVVPKGYKSRKEKKALAEQQRLLGEEKSASKSSDSDSTHLGENKESSK